MSGYGEPDWVNASQNNNQQDTVVDANTPSNVQAPPDSNNSGGGSGSAALWALSAFNIGLSAMMCALGVLTLISIHEYGLVELAEPFLASYMILFAALLFFYELMWWRPMPKVNKGLRRNFGFLYGLNGKGLYLIFVACLCLGLGKDASVKGLNYATGAAFLGGGCLHIFIVCMRPELASKYYAPTVGLTNDEPSTPNVV